VGGFKLKPFILPPESTVNVNNRVLIVEDDHTQRMLLYHILSIEGLSAICVGSGREAENEIGACAPDLILLDVDLPHKDGFAICRQLKNHPETRLIPIILITGLAQRRFRILGLELGADEFLDKPIDPPELLARIRSLLKRKAYTDELDRAEHVLMALGQSIEAKDTYTQGHCERLAIYSTIVGQEIGLGPDELHALRVAASVHDIGKVAVPDAILLKPEPLLPEEWQIMRQHPVVGEHICKPLQSFAMVLPIIRHHHEKQDGTGYPDGLSGPDIPLLARVLQVVDVFDALTTTRPYREALSCESALKIMRDEVEKGWWDPGLTEVVRRRVYQGRLQPPIETIHSVGSSGEVRRPPGCAFPSQNLPRSRR
jgi:putative two-component system response regulator